MIKGMKSTNSEKLQDHCRFWFDDAKHLGHIKDFSNQVQEEITMSRKYEKPLVIPLSTDRDSIGLGACQNGSANLNGRCRDGSSAPGGRCNEGISAGSWCINGTVASSRCKSGGNL